jgi:SAM-dependent methyltransferase
MCGGTLDPRQTVRRHGEIVSSTLACREGPHRYPVVEGRPLLLPKGAPRRWVSPVDEAMGLAELPTVAPFSFPRLRQMGLEAALKAIRDNEAGRRRTDSAESWDATPLTDGELPGKARYRLSGGWLSRGGRRRALLKPLDELPKRVRCWVESVRDARPRRILDLASGGGGGIASILKGYRGAELVCATERDLRCTWTIQSKARELGFRRMEAVGADVGRLPLRDGCFDAVTSLMGLQEILRMRDLLREVLRVLAPGGRWFALYGEPETWGEITRGTYMRFAREADMFGGHDALLRTAEKAGLRGETLGRFACGQRRYHAVAFHKA